MKKKIEFNGEYLNFDRVYKCDWCGGQTKVAITQYGTSHYNRLICEECAKKIIAYENSIYEEKREK